LMDPIIGVWDILQTCNQFQYCSKYWPPFSRGI
jgi:hypothetical protein